MREFLKFLSNWSEVWPFIIPLTIFFIHRSDDKRMHRLVWYLVLTFLVILVANYIGWYNDKVPAFLKNNNIFYNINSVLRAILAGGFLIYHPHLAKFKFLKYTLVVYVIVAAGIFILDRPFSHVSIILTSVTSILLLITCLTYFLNAIMDDEETITAKEPAFILSMGLSIYESINFFIYLFLYKLADDNMQFLKFTIKLFTYSVIVYNIFIAVAFYNARRKKTLLAA